MGVQITDAVGKRGDYSALAGEILAMDWNYSVQASLLERAGENRLRREYRQEDKSTPSQKQASPSAKGKGKGDPLHPLSSKPGSVRNKEGKTPLLLRTKTLFTPRSVLSRRGPTHSGPSSSVSGLKNLSVGAVSLGLAGDTFTISSRMEGQGGSLLPQRGLSPGILPEAELSKVKGKVPEKIVTGQALLKSYSDVLREQVFSGSLASAYHPSTTQISRTMATLYQAILMFAESSEMATTLPDARIRYLYGAYLLLSGGVVRAQNWRELFHRPHFDFARSKFTNLLRFQTPEKGVTQHPEKFQDFFSLTSRFSCDADWAAFVTWSLGPVSKEKKWRVTDEEEGKKGTRKEKIKPSKELFRSHIVAGGLKLYASLFRFIRT